MAKDTTKKRLRRALRQQQRREEARRHPGGPERGSGPYDSFPFSTEFDGPDQPRGDGLDGGAGVREPRRPAPTLPTAALELEPVDAVFLELGPELDHVGDRRLLLRA